jgi:hypothetical protein
MIFPDNDEMKQSFSNDGSFVLCILAKLKETDQGLACEVKMETLRLSKIVNALTGNHCQQLVGKPKLFFFVDPSKIETICTDDAGNANSQNVNELSIIYNKKNLDY